MNNKQKVYVCVYVCTQQDKGINSNEGGWSWEYHLMLVMRETVSNTLTFEQRYSSKKK